MDPAPPTEKLVSSPEEPQIEEKKLAPPLDTVSEMPAEQQIKEPSKKLVWKNIEYDQEFGKIVRANDRE